ncbi:MAG: homoserine kinase, partial [Acidimicrobiales bacterium]
SLPLDHDWRFVVVVPDEGLATADARAVLPAAVPMADAVANLAAMGLLVAGLADARAFVRGSMADRLHQPYRESLVPFARDLLDGLLDAGAVGSCWSGAGSSMLGLCLVSDAGHVESAARAFLSDRGIAGDVFNLDADHSGLVTM